MKNMFGAQFGIIVHIIFGDVRGTQYGFVPMFLLILIQVVNDLANQVVQRDRIVILVDRNTTATFNKLYF